MKDPHTDIEPLTPKPAVQSVRVPWNPWLAVIFVVFVYFLAQFLGGIFISIYPWLKHWDNSRANDWLTNSVPAQFFYVLLAEAITVGAIYLFLRHFKQGFKAIGLKRPHWRDPGFGLLAFPAYFVVYAVVLSVIYHFIHLNLNQQQNIGFTNVHGSLQLILTFFSLVVLPPLAEEIMMRGFLFSSLQKAMPVLWAALLTSAIFASAHLPEGGSSGPLWVGFIDTFTLSLVLCYLRQKTGSLWAGITLHALKNAVAFVSLFLLTSR
jgi:membrane protease YdiL (CAAX protease family)